MSRIYITQKKKRKKCIYKKQEKKILKKSLKKIKTKKKTVKIERKERKNYQQTTRLLFVSVYKAAQTSRLPFL